MVVQLMTDKLPQAPLKISAYGVKEPFKLAPNPEIVIVVPVELAVNLNQTSNVVAAVAPPQLPEAAPSVLADVAF
jgi:hypothetical protein